ncbi:hypothetical protein LJY25_05515 [Hymenobacter sp. BT175]|uniref:hypothetical protein n=1 Tax=Hymenobacter translucens TaxID=2886507 RepID=UPI001D0E1FC8|nr:hypothetical protein [Hymenobacter translucens]MCC2545894.1 hypothetical protein [Hymenobacter translucens]
MPRSILTLILFAVSFTAMLAFTLAAVRTASAAPEPGSYGTSLEETEVANRSAGKNSRPAALTDARSLRRNAFDQPRVVSNL